VWMMHFICLPGLKNDVSLSHPTFNHFIWSRIP